MMTLPVQPEAAKGQRAHDSSCQAPLVHHVNDGDGVQRIILARPQARNALSTQLVIDFNKALDLAIQLSTATANSALNGQAQVCSSAESNTSSLEEKAVKKSTPPRCLIIQATAGSPAFCAGADLVERSRMSQAEVFAFLHSLRLLFSRISSFPLPTIAAIDGPALGGGLEMALACDFRIAASNVTKLGLPEVRLGIIPCGGGTQRASRLLGMARAKDLIYTGRMIDSLQALEWGLVDYLADAKAGESAVMRAECLARSMSQGAPLALMQAKVAITTGFDLGLETALDFEQSCYATLIDTQDRKEALMAFQQKRTPQFVGC